MQGQCIKIYTLHQKSVIEDPQMNIQYEVLTFAKFSGQFLTCKECSFALLVLFTTLHVLAPQYKKRLEFI